MYTGFDRKVISELVDNFKEVNHITRLHFLPSKIYTKTYKAIDNSKEEIRKEISTFQKLNIKKYAEDFKKWMFENNISKKTKQNFKNFTKEKAIKIDEILITKVIDYNTDEII